VSYPADLYAALHDGTPGDVEFYVEACRGAASVLELGCGYGRLVVPLARAGLDVVGLDIDPDLLALAEATVGDALVPAELPRVALARGDMRAFEQGTTFDRVLLPFSGLYCLMEDDDVARCFAGIRRHLAPGGTLVLDAYMADRFHDAPDDVDRDVFVPVRTVFARQQFWTVLERSTWDRDAQRIDVTYLYVPEQGDEIECTLTQRYVRTDALREFLAAADLHLHTLHGGYAGEPLTDDSEVWVATATAG
jgi:SAM-dependent methyltransferase